MTRLLHLIKWITVLVGVFGLAFFVYVAVKINEPLKTHGSGKIFIVEAGTTTKQVGQNLEELGFINRNLFFKLYIYFEKKDGRIQAGSYELSPGMSIKQIADRLIAGEVISNQIKFTVIEGWTSSDIASALEKQGLVSASQFMAAVNAPHSNYDFGFAGEITREASLEGFLFPDTYLFSKDMNAQDIAKKLLANFNKKLTADLQEDLNRQGKKLYDVIILASIIEREVGRIKEKLSAEDLATLQEERRLVASVFYNRLRAGMPLDSDATISYLTGRKGSSRATVEETKIDSPYNTYKYQGLPHGPISNPSLDAIKAAINPAKSDYLYFLTAPDGTAYFARTLQEHIANRAKYLGD